MVWELWWPKLLSDNAITAEVQESFCHFDSFGSSPILLKPDILFIVFQQSNELSQKI
jgi:hypothetical protein